MEEGLFGFQIKFEGQGEHYIVLDRHQELKLEHLSALQVRMLETGRIPGVLPLYVYEIDEKVRLHYGIYEKSMLYYALRMRQPTERDLHRLLSSIVSTIGNSLEYMLNETGYLIHERLVFVGEGWEETQLVYAPAKLEDVPSLRDQIERFIGVLADFMRGNATYRNGDLIDLTALQHFCRHPQWSLSSLKQKLGEMDRTSLPPVGQPETDAVHEKAFEMPEALPLLPDQENSSLLKPEKAPQPQIKNKIIIYLAIFICAFAWMMSAADATEHSLYIGFGATFLMVAAIVFTMPAKMFEGRLRAIDRSEEIDEGLFFFKNDNSGQEADKMIKPVYFSAKQEVDLDEYYRQLGNRTALLPQQDASMLTVALDMESLLIGKHAPKPKPMLELWRNHVQERVPIDRDPFLIGRGDSDVNLSIPAPDVSRLHAEICIESDGLAIRDLKAKNGTTLNDLSLAPYERYTLSDGDVIGIGAYKLVFKLIAA